MAYVATFIGELVGTSCIPERVWFSHDAPTDGAAIEALFGCPVAFGAATSGMVIPRSIAGRVVSADPALQQLVRARLDELMPAASAPLASSTRVRAELVQRIGRDDVSVVKIAQALGVSKRSLQRALAAEGRPFQALVDDARRCLAETLLARPDLTIEAVAVLVGYAETRGFDRAFRRWTGKTPTAFRAECAAKLSHDMR
jgi:AraC-like DNA-binding protein